MPEARPDLAASMSGSELQRWYWLKSELLDLARELGVSTSGRKIELTERIAAGSTAARCSHTRLDRRPEPRPGSRNR